jgi:hypothetical protein
VRLIALLERVVDALFEDLIWILWSTGSLWSWLRVGETEVTEEFAEIIWMVLNVEFIEKKLLDFL